MNHKHRHPKLLSMTLGAKDYPSVFRISPRMRLFLAAHPQPADLPCPRFLLVFHVILIVRPCRHYCCMGSINGRMDQSMMDGSIDDGWVLRREGVGYAECAQQAAPGAVAPSRGGGGLVEATEVAPAARPPPAGAETEPGREKLGEREVEG